MRRLFLPLPSGSNSQPSFLSLQDFLIANIESSPKTHITTEFAETMIRQGSVWFGNQRIKDPKLNVNTLYNPAERQAASEKRRSGQVGKAPKKPLTPPKPISPPNSDEDDLHEMRYGPWLQIFYPEKSISEYSLDSNHIKYEDRDLLIVYKEAMLNTCQSVFSDTNCLTWGVQKYLNQTSELPEPYQVNTINRLDFATRGLVFYAKNKTAEIALHKMFMNRHIHKRYLVVTPAFVLPTTQELLPKIPEGAQVRGGIHGRGNFGLKIRDTLEWRGKIQESSTLIRLLGRDKSQTRFLWMALPQTGRTHQIRKHFSRYLVPIIGDPVYGLGLYGPTDDLLLACVSYRFRHPISGQTIRVEYLPEDMHLECAEMYREKPKPHHAGSV